MFQILAGRSNLDIEVGLLVQPYLQDSMRQHPHLGEVDESVRVEILYTLLYRDEVCEVDPYIRHTRWVTPENRGSLSLVRYGSGVLCCYKLLPNHRYQVEISQNSRNLQIQYLKYTLYTDKRLAAAVIHIWLILNIRHKLYVKFEEKSTV